MELMCGQGQQNDKTSAVLGLPRQVPNFAGTVLDVVSKASMNAEALRRLELSSQGFHRHMSRNRTIKILLAAAAQQVYKHIRQ